MDQIAEFVDERQKSGCIQCGAWIGGVQTSNDHVPSKNLLRKPFPENLPVVKICKDCNSSFSADEEYLFLFLHCVLTEATDPNRHIDARVARALRRHKRLHSRIKNSRMEYETIGGDTRCVWKLETERVSRVVIKNARGHAFYEFGEPMLDEPEHVWIAQLETMTVTERAEFDNVQMNTIFPEVGSRMMTRMITGQNLRNSWIVVQDGVYRYSLDHRDGVLVRSVLMEYLATEVFWRY